MNHYFKVASSIFYICFRYPKDQPGPFPYFFPQTEVVYVTSYLCMLNLCQMFGSSFRPWNLKWLYWISCHRLCFCAHQSDCLFYENPLRGGVMLVFTICSNLAAFESLTTNSCMKISIVFGADF